MTLFIVPPHHGLNLYALGKCGVHMMEIGQTLERNDVPCNSMHQSEGHYVKRNKPDIEGQKLYLSHMWNLRIDKFIEIE